MCVPNAVAERDSVSWLDPFSETWKKEYIRDLWRASHFSGLGIAAKISSPIVKSGDNRRSGVGYTVR
jgi:hypothetical protein